MKRIISLLLACIMLLSLVACGNKSTAQEGSATKETKDTLKIAITADIPSLDPYAQNTDISNSFTLLFYDRLLDVDINTGELIPSLAESYEVVSAKEYVFHLRQGVKFHEGQELKASDVKFSLERVAESTGMSAKVAQIDHVEVVDDYTVRIVLNTASTTILNNLAFAGTSILSEEWCKAHQDSYVINGTGAYKFVEWNPGESVLLERNEEYWGEGGKMQYLKFVVMPEANARTIALENGEIDVDSLPATISYSRYEAAENIELYSSPSTKVCYMSMSYNFEPFQNVKVRQAIAMAINKQDMIDGFADGYGKVKTTILGDGQQYCDNSIPGYEYDVEAAKALLAEAGYPDGFDLELVLRGEAYSTLAAILQEQLSKIGVRVSVNKMESAAYTEYNMQEKTQSVLHHYQPATSDADNPLRNLLHSESKASSNTARYKNADYDALITAAVQETDPAKAQDLYSQIQMKIYEDVPLIPLFSLFWSVAANSHVKGVQIPAVGDAMAFKNMYWE